MAKERESAIFIDSDRKATPWFVSMMREIADEEGIPVVDATIVGSCEHWGKKYPELMKKYKAWREASSK